MIVPDIVKDKWKPQSTTLDILTELQAEKVRNDLLEARILALENK